MTKTNLTLEQQVHVRALEVALLDVDNPIVLRQKIIDLYRQNLAMHNTYQNLLAHQWGIYDRPSYTQPLTPNP